MSAVMAVLVALIAAQEPAAAAPPRGGRADALEAMNAERAKAGLLPRKRVVRVRAARGRPVAVPMPVELAAETQPPAAPAVELPAAPAERIERAARPEREPRPEPREAERLAVSSPPPERTGYLMVVLDAARALGRGAPASRGASADVAIEEVRAVVAGLRVEGTVALRGDGITLGMVRGGTTPAAALASGMPGPVAAARPTPTAATLNPAVREVLSFRRDADARIVQIVREVDGALTEVTRDAGGHVLSTRPLPGAERPAAP